MKKEADFRITERFESRCGNDTENKFFRRINFGVKRNCLKAKFGEPMSAKRRDGLFTRANEVENCSYVGY